VYDGQRNRRSIITDYREQVEYIIRHSVAVISKAWRRGRIQWWANDLPPYPLDHRVRPVIGIRSLWLKLITDSTDILDILIWGGKAGLYSKLIQNGSDHNHVLPRAAYLLKRIRARRNIPNAVLERGGMILHEYERVLRYDLVAGGQ